MEYPPAEHGQRPPLEDEDLESLSDNERLIALYPEFDPDPDILYPYVRSIDNSSVRCICDVPFDDGATIQCDLCFVWQHMVCVGIDRSNIPKAYYCEGCKPRWFDAEVHLGRTCGIGNQ
jgi:hypothetical protein